MIKFLQMRMNGNGSENSIKSSWIMYIYLHYFLFVWVTDLVNLICLYAGMEQSFAMSHLLALICIGAVILLDRKWFEFESDKLLWVEYVILIAILVLGVYKCIYPDTAFDTMTYHAISQSPAWEGRESFYYYELSFPFADRLFYVFRYFLGYRLGTIANAFVLVVIYNQTKRITKSILKKSNIDTETTKMKLGIALGVTAIIMLEAVLMELGTYLTDIVAIPLMLEVLIFMIESIKKDKVPFEEMVYVVICLSFIFLCKFVSSIVVATYLIIYLCVIYKSVTVKRFFACLSTAIVLILPFISYNIYLVGEPLFEFSFIFKGYANDSLDSRWGGENLLQKILWPIYMASYPSERHMEIIDMPNYYPLFGLLFVIIEFIKGKKSLITKELKAFSIATIIAFYLWSFSGGVDRYALINLIGFGVILLCGGIIYLVHNNRWMIFIASIILIIQCIGSFWCVMIINNNWQSAPSLLNQILTGDNSYKEQLAYIGRDKGNIIENGNEYKVFLIPDRQYSFWARSINEEAKIFQVFNIGQLSEEKQNQFIEELEKYFNEGTVYAACRVSEEEECVQNLKTYNLVAKQVEYLNDTYIGDVAVMQVEYSEYPLLELEDEIWRLRDNLETEFVTVEGKVETTDNPYGYNVGAIEDVEVGKTILLNPGTLIQINTEIPESAVLELTSGIHPWVAGNSDGAILNIDISVGVQKTSFSYNIDATKQNWKLDLTEYAGDDVAIKVYLSNEAGCNELNDWGILYKFELKQMQTDEQ